MTISAGSRLGPYEVLSALGAGGMGEVWRARDPRLGREVAIKVLPSSFSADADRLRRFEQEARAAGILNHPNLTAVFDIGEHEGAPYVVQELLEGETLRGALAGGRLVARRAIDFAIQIAHGLAAAHEKGIVHRDLKPENVFVTKDGRVKILDFGLAKLTRPEEGSQSTNLPTASAGTEPGVVLGTLGYMSPEQVRGKPADARSDIFSFGAILYEMLSGKRAFHGDSAADTMSAILKEDPPDLSVTNQSISPGLERIVRHCLEKNPEQRFHSAHDLAFDLEALSATSGVGTAVSATPIRSRARALGFVAVALALAAVGLAAFLAGRRWTASRGAGGSSPTFHRLTFRRGFVQAARFAPDGQTIVYSAAWDGKPNEIFSTRVGATESRALGLPGADVFAISSSGELAIRLRRPYGVPDMLARVPLAGGAPREVLEDVAIADWSPGGSDLAVVRFVGGLPRIEFPIGKKLYEAPSLEAWHSDLRLSSKGDQIVFWDGLGDSAALKVLDRSGKTRSLTAGWAGSGLAWSPSGKEIWFTATNGHGPPWLQAVDLSGNVRPILRVPGWLWLQDISSDGRVLLTHNAWRAGLNWLRSGEKREEDVSWLDWSMAKDLSSDGKTILFDETREGSAGASGSVFLRKAGEGSAIRLGEGVARALSPDGKWALASIETVSEKPARLILLPTGAGEAKTLATEKAVGFGAARWFPDGKRILYWEADTGQRGRLYVQDIETGTRRAITPAEDPSSPAISPDGKLVACRINQKVMLYPVDGGEPRPMPGLTEGEVPIRFAADGSLYVVRRAEVPARVFRVDPLSGRREPWKEILPSDPAGIEEIWPIAIAPDGNSYVYTYQRRFSDLYVVEGLK
jgi:eukaryotic-like serine/threonine-protein kinase